jgi:hypothetical protein
MTLVGVSQQWIGQYLQTELLAEPVAVTDGGDPLAEAVRDDRGVPFQPVVLDAGAQRVIGVEFRTTTNVTDACERWSAGTGLVWNSVPIEWHLLISAHTKDIDFDQPIEFMAPTEADCSG